ncbi:PQQ-binding-like beta-propeller repeat protein [Pontiella sulfatireligans]|uniref:PQQ-binding-like beta-propeller repeat protein n=1 Tax=Pontiella sulfatireligans TaxID=2750658 RepID=UPI0014440A01|nr:PQQ-binding-like beta-propeller repeat protein [Pontiella sulfatireligans]
MAILLIVSVQIFADWPQFLGVGREGRSAEQGLTADLSSTKTLWMHPRGESYSAPSVSGNRLIHHARFQSTEKVECLDATTGALLWSDGIPVTYRDRFGYLNGPRASPSIDGDRVYALGVQGALSCYQLQDGKLLWRRQLVNEFGVSMEFFGFAGSPLVEGGLVVVNLGMKKCVAAFDKLTGETKWVSGDQWGRSYASPVAAAMHGRRVLLVFAGGESNPPVGGLLCLDPSSGKILDRFAWRSPRHASANASTPVVSGNRVFISSSYDVGGVMLEVLPDFTFKEVYRTKAYASHWATPILVDGHLYGFANNKLVCMEWATGKRVWRTVPKLEGASAADASEGAGRGADRYRPPPGEGGFGIGSLIYADGRFLCLGENGLLAWLELSPDGCTILSAVRLFKADQSWTGPVLSGGRAYIGQNLPDGKHAARLICLDLNKESGDGE